MIIELHLTRSPDGALHALLRADLPSGGASLSPAAPVTLAPEALHALEGLSDAYGAALTALAIPALLHQGWERARGANEHAGAGLHVRVVIDDPTGALHGLRWELLRDPRTNTPLATQEHGSLARQIVRDRLDDPALPPRPALRALVAVAGPRDAARWGLHPVDVPAEAARALSALGDIPADLLAGERPDSQGPATLEHLRDSLRAGPHLLYLIAHGKTTKTGSTLYLVTTDGDAAPITGADLADAIQALDPAHRPLLAVLLACESASQQDAPLAAVGPLLASAGIPAVIAMQAPIAIDAAGQFTARLLRELVRDGRMDAP